VLASGAGTNLQALLDHHAAGDLGADITAVLSDQPDAGALGRARAAGVPAQALPPADYADRDAFDRALAEAVAAHEPDLVVLAGFMRILGAPFVERFAGRTLNIHPSLLPAFRGLHTHRKALEAGCRLHGTTVHFVTADLDAGPIVAQAAVRVRDDDTPDSLRARVQAREHRLLPQAVNWFAEGRLAVEGNRVRVAGHGEDEGHLEAPALELDSEPGASTL
jgi:phosphoribosylglycinamide formyltransferase-1